MVKSFSCISPHFKRLIYSDSIILQVSFEKVNAELELPDRKLNDPHLTQVLLHSTTLCICSLRSVLSLSCLSILPKRSCFCFSCHWDCLSGCISYCALHVAHSVFPGLKLTPVASDWRHWPGRATADNSLGGQRTGCAPSLCLGSPSALFIRIWR